MAPARINALFVFENRSASQFSTIEARARPAFARKATVYGGMGSDFFSFQKKYCFSAAIPVPLKEADGTERFIHIEREGRQAGTSKLFTSSGEGSQRMPV